MADRRAQIEARLAAATPGPWRVDRYDHGGGRAYIEEPRRTLIADFYQEGDREMLASAPDDLRWLLDALTTVEVERDALAAKLAAVEGLVALEADTPGAVDGLLSSLREALEITP